ncbi:hypothetical protein B0A49_08648 [Cryomyces minteri]|uniref:2EXR domain-containing protein n=2 Tax=Cryomyces minteri TaxID=331657 RepID=A0A4U0WU07_9PEZI|nr:hypothetical protein B0A49_08648 [Cryomyces minteri]
MIAGQVVLGGSRVKKHLQTLRRRPKMVTRNAAAGVRNTFPFEKLPAELRNMIYHFALSLRGVDTYLKDCITDSRHHYLGVEPRSNTNPLLLLNRQTYLEASSVLYNKPLAISHGLLVGMSLTKIVSSDILHYVSNVTISDVGYNSFGHNHSIVEMLELYARLVDEWIKSHSLQTLQITLQDEVVVKHIKSCWNRDGCGYCDRVRLMMDCLGRLRGVKHVTFTGPFVDSYIEPIKKRMQSPPKSFTDLPGELRNKIYDYVLGFRTINKQIQGYNNSLLLLGVLTLPKRSTPTILLLNRQINQEAMGVLRGKPLVLTNSPRGRDAIFHFISPATLQKLPCVILRIDLTITNATTIDHWQSLADTLSALWAQKHSLVNLHFHLQDGLAASIMQRGGSYPDLCIRQIFEPFKTVRGIDQVTFQGALPECFTSPLKYNMEASLFSGVAIPLQACLNGLHITLQ